MNIKIEDLYVGNTDARNEYSLLDEHERRSLDECFVVPPTLTLKSFLEGKKYFLTGMKGTGKTATLLHLSRLLSRDGQAASHFVYFKSDLSADDLARLSKIANSTVASVESGEYPDADYQPAWRWFLYRQLVRAAEADKVSPSRRDESWDRFASLMKSPSTDEEASGFERWIPKLAKGAVTVSKDPKLEFSAEWDFQGKAKVSFNKLIMRADEYFRLLGAGPDTLYVFIDELELRRSTQKQYERDARLIGDLILAVAEFNRRAKEQGVGVRVYAAIRSEVMSVVTASGREINKPIEDLGTRIVWDPTGADDRSHPLLQVMMKRLRSSLRAKQQDSSDEEVWSRMFPQEIDGDPIEKYLLHRTWFRPRDVIRRLNVARETYPSAGAFSASVLTGSSKEYSRFCWFELQEELAASYSADEIQGIHTVLTAIGRDFSLHQLEQRAKDLSAADSEVSRLLERRKVSDIASDLYRVGIIGNLLRVRSAMRPRFAFRGDEKLLKGEQMCVHKALRQYLSIH